MELRCHCAQCGADFSVGQEFAGGNVRCVKCGQQIALPPAQKRQSPPVAKRIAPPPAPEGLPGGLPEGLIDLDFTTATGSFTTATGSRPAHKTAHKPPSMIGKKKKKGWQGWQIAVVAGGVLAAVLGVVLAIVCNLPSGKQKQPQASMKSASLLIKLEDGDRSGVELSIDDGKGAKRKELPSSGPVKFALEAGKYTVKMSRPGKKAEDSFSLAPGQTYTCLPLWENDFASAPPAPAQPADDSVTAPDFPAMPSAPSQPKKTEKWAFDGWLQDFEQAKQTATEEKKNILVAFTGSDWCGYCQQLAREVFGEPDFKKKVAKDFVLVCIDSPQGSEARARVENMARNQQLVRQFGVRGFPMAVLTDAKGRVFGELRGYRQGGVDSYVAALDGCKAVGEKLSKALDRIEAGGDNEARRTAASDALQTVEEKDLKKYYADDIEKWERIAKASDASEKPSPSSSPSSPPQPPVAKPVPGVPERTADMSAEEFLKACKLVKYGRTWILAEDKNWIQDVRDLDKQAKEIASKTDAVRQIDKNASAAARLRQEAVEGLDAVHQKLASGIPTFKSEMDAAEENLAKAKKAANAAEATAEEARNEALKAIERVKPRIANLRPSFEMARKYYALLDRSREVRKALEELPEPSPGKKYNLGPTTMFAAAEGKISAFEAAVAIPPEWVPVAVDMNQQHGASLVQVEIKNGDKSKTLEMVVDTGATALSLPWRIAVELGLDPAKGKQSLAQDARGGRTVVRTLKIPVVRVAGPEGAAEAKDVTCVVLPPKIPNSPLLLGTSFLDRFQHQRDKVRGKLVFSKALDDKAELQHPRR